jgi:hypothetical protein
LTLAFDAHACAADLCRIFLGWKLREDYDALVAIGEGALRIDLESGEAWCDGDPLPALFIAAELQRELAAALERAGATPGTVTRADLDAEFAVDGGRLRIACRCALTTAEGIATADGRTGTVVNR